MIAALVSYLVAAIAAALVMFCARPRRNPDVHPSAKLPRTLAEHRNLRNLA